MEERLQKFLANSGIASRRKCEELILQGKVAVNGKIVTELGTKINTETITKPLTIFVIAWIKSFESTISIKIKKNGV